jgi:hypothetical protein
MKINGQTNCAAVAALKCLQAESRRGLHTPLDALLFALLPPSPGFGGTDDRAWTYSLPARSVCALSLRERMNQRRNCWNPSSYE